MHFPEDRSNQRKKSIRMIKQSGNPFLDLLCCFEKRKRLGNREEMELAGSGFVLPAVSIGPTYCRKVESKSE